MSCPQLLHCEQAHEAGFLQYSKRRQQTVHSHHWQVSLPSNSWISHEYQPARALELHSESQLPSKHQQIGASTRDVRSGVSPARSPVGVCRLWFTYYSQTQCHRPWCGSEAEPHSDFRCLARSEVLGSSCLWAPQHFQAPKCCLWKVFHVNTVLLIHNSYSHTFLYLCWTNWVLHGALSISELLYEIGFFCFVVVFTLTSHAHDGLIRRNACYPSLPPLCFSSRYHLS